MSCCSFCSGRLRCTPRRPTRFDLSEIEKKPYHFGGYVEIKPTLFRTRQDASLYRLKYYNRDLGASLEEANLKLQLEGS